VIWHLLSEHTAERKLDLERLARKFYEFAYTVGKDNWSGCPSVATFIRMLLDQAGVRREMKGFIYCRKRVVLRPSALPPPGKVVCSNTSR